MPVIFKRKLVKIGNSFRVTIPMEIVQGQGWKEGEEILLIVNDGDVVLRNEKQIKKK